MVQIKALWRGGELVQEAPLTTLTQVHLLPVVPTAPVPTGVEAAIAVDGLRLTALMPGQRFVGGDGVLLEVAASAAASLLPLVVLQGGLLHQGDSLSSADEVITVGVITVSDKGSQGLRQDESGPLLVQMLADSGMRVLETAMVPDEQEEIAAWLRRFAEDRPLDLVVTTGGTGFASRDVTPEATMRVIERPAPGLAEAMRAASLAKTPHAMLSRAVAGIRRRTLIVNFPGSPKACRENLEVILPALPHGVQILRGVARDCARP